MALFVITLIVQVLLVIHVIKTGRNTIWIWVLMLLPYGVGALAYLAVEVIPELLRSRQTTRAVRGKRWKALCRPWLRSNASMPP